MPAPALFIIAGAVVAGKTRFYEAHLKDAFPRLVPAVDENLDAALGAKKSVATEAYWAAGLFLGTNPLSRRHFRVAFIRE